jgi:PH (Pleckstrin Homology) domain-containing protein
VTARRFGPSRALAVLWLALALVAAATAVATTDPRGRLLAGGAAIVLAAYGIIGLVFWPRLSVGPDGLRVHTPARRATYAWLEVEAVRLDERRRFGLSAGTLEIDARGELVVLSRWALGADPRDVLAVVRSYAPPGDEIVKT